MKMKIYCVALAAMAALAGCEGGNSGSGHSDSTKKVTYVAHLSPLNAQITGSNTQGEARFVIENDTMTVTIDVKNAPPGIEHWQHFHGFTNDSAATCATEADDKNGDGIIDVVETETASGTTMVPFNKLPAEMALGENTYPVADENGSYHYEAKIPMAGLKEAFAKAFPNSDIDLDRRVLYIHGVPDSATLPATVASIADIPAHVTLPIACGQIQKVNE